MLAAVVVAAAAAVPAQGSAAVCEPVGCPTLMYCTPPAKCKHCPNAPDPDGQCKNKTVRTSCPPGPCPGYSFGNVFQSGMVLQRDEPIRLWGHGDCAFNPCTIVMSQPGCTGLSCNQSQVVWGGNPTWSFVLSPAPGSGTGWVPAEPFSISLYRGCNGPCPCDGAGGCPGGCAGGCPGQYLCESGGCDTTGPPLATIDDLLLGDVVLVSGQSNVGISVKYSNQFNASAEAENLAEADRIGTSVRLMIVPQGGSPQPQAELATIPPCKLPSDQCGTLPWSRANRTTVVGFSALGWYLARELYAAQNESVPIGIVQSDVPGTPIQKWTPNNTISACFNGTFDPKTMSSDSSLFNAMIAPFTAGGLAFASVIWYQGDLSLSHSLHHCLVRAIATGFPTDLPNCRAGAGESNVGPNDHAGDAHGPMNGADYYGCALPAMVREWRRRLPGGDDLVTDTSLPFVIVELAAYCNEQDENTFRTFCDANTSRLTAPDFHLPELRLAQARVLEVPHAFLESAMDLGSLHPLPYESIHPTNKQEVARRVSLALRYALYGDTTLVYRGPVPTGAVFEDASGHVTVSFDVQAGAQGLSLDAKAGCPEVALDVYCRRKQLAGFEIQVGGEWQAPLSAALVPSDGGDVVLGAVDRPQRVRYAYSDWPVVSLRNKEGGLPARLFDIEVH